MVPSVLLMSIVEITVGIIVSTHAPAYRGVKTKIKYYLHFALSSNPGRVRKYKILI